MAFIVMTNMMLQSIGKGFKASVTASARNGIFFIPLILILPQLLGLLGVEITQAAARLPFPGRFRPLRRHGTAADDRGRTL